MCKQIGYIILALSFLLTGCASTMDVVRYSFTGPPEWTEKTSSIEIEEDQITVLGGPSPSLADARSQALTWLSARVISQIDTTMTQAIHVKADNDSRLVAQSYEESQRITSLVTLIGYEEIRRWRSPVTGEYYVLFSISQHDYEASKGATEKRLQILKELDEKLEGAFHSLIEDVKTTFSDRYMRGYDLYETVINREWEEPLYTELEGQPVQIERYLVNSLEQGLSSLRLIGPDRLLEVEDDQAITIVWQMTSDQYSSLQLAGLQFTLSEEQTGLKVTNSAGADGSISFTLAPGTFELGTYRLSCELTGLPQIQGKDPSKTPGSEVALQVIHTPESPQGIKATRGNPSWSQVNLVWERSSDASFYKVYRSQMDDPFYEEIGTTSSLSWIDRGVEEQMIYTYKVAAVHSSGSQSTKSSAARLMTSSKPKLSVSVSDSKAYACRSIAIHWDYSKEVPERSGYVTIKLYRSGQTLYSFSHIADTGAYHWEIPNDLQEGRFSVGIVEEATGLTSTSDPVVELLGAHSHDSNRREFIGSLDYRQEYERTGSVCEAQPVDQYELKVSAFFSHSFSISVLPSSPHTDLSLQVIDMDSGRVIETVSERRAGQAEDRNLSLGNGSYLLRVIYAGGAGGRYTFSCRRI